jgi:hypothetical protein
MDAACTAGGVRSISLGSFLAKLDGTRDTVSAHRAITAVHFLVVVFHQHTNVENVILVTSEELDTVKAKSGRL